MSGGDFPKGKKLVYIIVVLSTCLIYSCASKEPAINNSENVKIIAPKCKGVSIYGKLQKTDNTYTFSKFSNFFIKPNDTPWIKINDNEPMWFVGNEYKCIDRKDAHYNCKTINESFFRFPKKRSLNIYNVHVPTSYVDVEFDKKKYAIAYNEAYKKNCIDFCNKIIMFSNRYNAIIEHYDEIVSEYNEKYQDVQNNIQIKYRDESGCYINQCDIRQKIKVDILKNKLHKKRPRIPSYSTKSFTSLIDKMNTFLDGKYDQKNYFSKLAKTCSYYTLHCEKQKCKDVEYVLSYPKKIDINTKKNPPIIEIVINNVNCRDVKPSFIEGKDKNLKLVFSDDIILLTNMSDNYLTVDNIAFYYNGQITSNNNSIDLPPQSTNVEILFSKFNVKSKYINFEQMTKEKAQNINIDYGFAVKYRIVDLDKGITLYKTQKYNLFDLIKRKKAKYLNEKIERRSSL